MHLELVDWLVVAGYALFAIGVGIVYAKKAGSDVDQFFLSGRSLPWWIAGTSMVATTFAADTPLVITGWVRDDGIWKNWLWWCYAGGGLMTVFLFARYWRRGGVMTKAELAELRYGGSGARVLRGFLGVYHAAITNTIVLCWVLLAASKIMEVLLGTDKVAALVIASALALSYSLMAGFWGVVLTDLLQFVMAMVGAIALAWLSWSAIGGTTGFFDELASGTSGVGPDTLAFLPATGDGGWLDIGSWTVNATAIAVYLGVGWWAVESVDGGTLVVQRIAATRDERQGMLAALWYNIAHFALRPWPWILVALASIVYFPHAEVTAGFDGTVVAVSEDNDHLIIVDATGARHDIALAAPVRGEDGTTTESQAWRMIPSIKPGNEFRADDVIASTDSERAYVAMMTRFLPAGLLGLVVASLLAAFMSTIDTHVNLAASFFVNDVYRRFLAPEHDPRYYVLAARVTSALVLAMAGVMAWQAESISDLFQFFLAFLGGVGPVYILRWLWWRVRASTEITALLTSSVVTILLTVKWKGEWPISALTPDGDLSAPGRTVIVAFVSLVVALASMLVTTRPDPNTLTEFYRRVRPLGAWGPVRALCPEVDVPREGPAVLAGVVGALLTTFGLMFALGFHFLDRGGDAMLAASCAAVGLAPMLWSLSRLLSTPSAPAVSLRPTTGDDPTRS